MTRDEKIQRIAALLLADRGGVEAALNLLERRADRAEVWRRNELSARQCTTLDSLVKETLRKAEQRKGSNG